MIQRTIRLPNLKFKTSLWIFLTTMIPLLFWANPIVAQSIPGIQTSIRESSQRAIVVELTTGAYEVERLIHTSVEFQRIQMAGVLQTVAPGMPQVPTHGVTLGVPTMDDVSVEIVDTNYETLSGYRLYPAPSHIVDDGSLDLSSTGTVHEVFTLDSSIYALDAFYPSAPAHLGQVGYMRDQAVAQVQFYPVQFNPVRGEVRLYHRIVVRITWSGDIQAASVNERYRSPDYENLLSATLLNYNSLQHPVSGPVEAAHLDSSSRVQNNAPSFSNSSAMVKIGISESGIYRISFADLMRVGLDLSRVDPHLLKMTNQGKEIAIYVNGQEDGVFNESDYILFYGTAINDAYTKQNIYWLFVGSDLGQRMPIRDGAPLDNIATIARFPTTIHAEEDTTYWRTMPDQEGDRWFWDTRLSPNSNGLSKSRKYQVQVGRMAPGNLSATVRVRLKGFTSLQHRTRIYINNKAIDDQTWSGQIEFSHQSDISQALLQAGVNEIKIETVDTGVSIDQILVNWIEIDYWGAFTAKDGELWFSVRESGQQKFAIEGFDGNDVGIWDISDPTSPVRITGATVASMNTSYSVTFNDSVHPNNHYVLLTSRKYKLPSFVMMDQPSAWKSPNNGANYIIITHESFYNSALTLAEHRRALGLRVAVVLVGDLYDEFNYGIFNPVAIRDFLTYAYHYWQGPAPTYVVLMGDANQDYKDNLKNGTINYVPSQNIVIDGSNEVSSDNWFVAINGNDNLPDMFVGRLVAQSPDEADAMVQKIINYEQNPPDDSWNKNVLLVATDEEPLFLDLSEQIAAQLPYYYQASRIYVTNKPSNNPRSDIINQVNHGAIFLNYAGHGWYFGWGRQDTNIFFENADVDLLNNINRLPIITVANCLNGFFAGPKDKPALAEVLVRRKNAGAVAVWAPSDFGDPVGHRLLLNSFYQAIFVGDQQTLGAATTAAKFTTFTYSSFWSGLIETYVLFGDPAMKLGIPANFPYLRDVSPTNGSEEIPLDQSIRLVFNKPVAPNTITISSVGTENLGFQSSWNSDFTIADFAHIDFEHGKKYQLIVNGQDRLGNQIGQGIVSNPWSFTITNDNVVPNGSAKIQGGDNPFALTTAIINISFTKPIRADSVTYSITPSVKGSLSWDKDGQQAMFLHERFREGQTYTFTILTAKDIAGNYLSKPFQVTFVVGKTMYLYFPLISHRN